MAIEELLRAVERARARSRARRAGYRVALLGSALLAAGLALERSGVDLPLYRLPPAEGVAPFPGFLAISFAALLQGVLFLAILLTAAWAVAAGAPRLLERAPRRTAADLDARFGTDRFSAALEARGPLAPLVAREASDPPPPRHALALAPPGRLRRWLLRLAMLVVLAVALLPGVAPDGKEGAAPVAGRPETGGAASPLALLLDGPREAFAPGQPILLDLLGRRGDATGGALSLPVALRIDDGPPRPVPGTLEIPAGEGAEGRLRFDLLVAEDASALAPGSHRAVAVAGGVESNAYLFRIDPAAARTPPPPPPAPQDPPRPEAGPEPKGTKEEWKPKFVEPLVREGPKREKQARVPIEAPDGGAPVDRPLDEAWPELQRRQEAALGRPGLSPESRALIRAYFERLRPR